MIRPVKRKGRTVYQVYLRDAAGKKLYKGTRDTDRAARELEQDAAVDQRKMDRGELAPKHDVKRTLAAASEDWLKTLEQRKSRSVTTFREHMKTILVTLGKVPIADLKKADVLGWQDFAATRYAPTTINVALSILKVALDAFVDRGWLVGNVARPVKRLKVSDKQKPWIKTAPEIERLIAKCSDPDLQDVVALALGTGLRVGELLALQWSDVDLKSRLLTIQRGGQDDTTKSGTWRSVPILTSVLPVLQARALRRAGAITVFPKRTAGVIARRYKLAVTCAALDRALTFHSLRHTFASHWMMNGGDIFKLSRILGHATPVITARVYAHLSPQAFTADYDRVSFALPGDGRVLHLAAV